MTSLKAMIAGPEPVLAPLVLNPLMARMAAEAGFRALYLGGGATGYEKVALEANLSAIEMAQAGIEIRAACDLPLIMDAAAGFGDPMHIHRTIGLAEAAGFAAIEIEDQLLPKRAHHHIGIEHMVPMDLMAAKVREAVAARRNPDFIVIARTNGVRASDLDDALRRAEAYHEAGADLLLLSPRSDDEVRHIGERLPPPLMHILPLGGMAAHDISLADMHGLGWRLLVDSQTALMAAVAAWREHYARMARDGFADRTRGAADWQAIQDSIHTTIDLERLLAIEKATVEKDG